jgi:hypothetical protein
MCCGPGAFFPGFCLRFPARFFSIKRPLPARTTGSLEEKTGVMHEQLESYARYLAYRSWRLQDPGATHSQGWEYALKHWANFLFEAKRHFNLEEEDLGLLHDGSWWWSVPALAPAT